MIRLVWRIRTNAVVPPRLPAVGVYVLARLEVNGFLGPQRALFPTGRKFELRARTARVAVGPYVTLLVHNGLCTKQLS